MIFPTFNLYHLFMWLWIRSNLTLTSALLVVNAVKMVLCRIFVLHRNVPSSQGFLAAACLIIKVTCTNPHGILSRPFDIMFQLRGVPMLDLVSNLGELVFVSCINGWWLILLKHVMMRGLFDAYIGRWYLRTTVNWVYRCGTDSSGRSKIIFLNFHCTLSDFWKNFIVEYI